MVLQHRPCVLADTIEVVLLLSRSYFLEVVLLEVVPVVENEEVVQSLTVHPG